MKRKSLLLLAVTLMCLCLLVLASCQPHRHTYSDMWHADADNHWHAADCIHTDEKTDVAPHTWDGGTIKTPATATEDGVKVYKCTVCNYEREQVIPATSHEHSYTASIVAPTCTEDGYTEHTCTCGDSYRDTPVDKLGHSYGTWTSNNDGTHSRTCQHDAAHVETDSCAPAQGTDRVVPPTCTEVGYTEHTCAACSYTYRDTPTDALDHEFGAWVSNEDGTHTRTCSHDSEHTQTEECQYSMTTVAPTCTAEGYDAYTCACGDSYQENPKSALSHAWGAWVSNDDGTHTRTCTRDSAHTEEDDCSYTSTTVAPTCTEDGYTQHLCLCGHTYRDATVGKLNHSYGAWVSNEDGTHTRICTRDSAHTETKDCAYTSAVTAPTCTAVGYTTFTCACGHTYRGNETAALNHDFAAWVSNEDGTHIRICKNDEKHKEQLSCTYVAAVTAPTCTVDGYTTHTCSVCEHSYRDAQVEATGHTYALTWSSDGAYHWHAATCGCANEKSDYTEHVYTTAVTEPTCAAQGFTTHTCACGHSYRDSITPAKVHTVATWTKGTPTLFRAAGCEYAVPYSGECSTCHQMVSKTEIVINHNLVPRVITAATCQSAGVKGQFCSNSACKHNTTPYGETTTYTDPNAHDWKKDETASTETLAVYTCKNDCTATRKVAVGNTADLSSGDLADTSEIELQGGATVGLDQGIKDKFKDEDVSISAGTLEGGDKQNAIDSSNLNEQDKALAGNSTVYSFTLTTSSEQHELGGTATIRVRYDLQPGDDPDCIIVWYMEDGKLTPVEATYSEDENGFGYVTFTTKHFSYYLVGSMTPAEMCERYGHSDTRQQVIAPTCTENGYTICLRCNSVIPGTTVAATGHTMGAEIIKAPTCSENGETAHTCVDCGFRYTTDTAAIGHHYVLSKQTAATCTVGGTSTYTCAHCGESYELTSQKLGHILEVRVITPTCTSGGYTEKTCTRCGEVTQSNFVAPTGHTVSTVWYASPDEHYHLCTVCGEQLHTAAHTAGPEATEHSAQICTVCAYTLQAPLTHVHVLTKVDAVTPDCTTGGNIAYYTCACGAWFLDEQAAQPIVNHMSVFVDAKGHDMQHIAATQPTCTSTGFTAGIWCETCQTWLRGHIEMPMLQHEYLTTTKAPTCTQAGSITYTCAWCGDDQNGKTVTIDPLDHDLKGVVTAPSCASNGYTTYTCTRCEHSAQGDEVAPLGHKYATAYTSDENGHYHVCLRCRAATTSEAHKPDHTEATEEHGITCILCNYLIAPAVNHTHTPSVTVDAVEPTCTSAGSLGYYICSCGEWFYDEACTTIITNRTSVLLSAYGHAAEYQAAIPATCETVGYTAGIYCTRCQSYINGHVEVPKTAHIFLGAYVGSTEDAHTRLCVVCGTASEPEAHTYTVKVTAPTCAEEGFTTHTCACGYSYTDNTVTALTHAFGDWRANGDGTHTRICSHDARHTETVDCVYTSVVTAPTCQAGGFTTYTCTCGHTYVSDYTTVSHNYETTTVAPTCTASGYDEHICQTCGVSYRDELTDALGHNFGAWVSNDDGTHSRTCKNDKEHTETAACVYKLVITAPTCTEEGFTTHTCACGHSFTDTQTAPSGHLWGELVCNGDGTHSRTCTRDDKHVETLTCTYFETVTPPTCAEEGYTTFTCVCGHTYTGEPTDKLAHTYENGLCTVCGAEQPTVGNIKYTYTETITDETGKVYGTATMEFCKDGTVIVRLESIDGKTETETFFWSESGNSIYIYMEEDAPLFEGRMTIGADGSLSIFVCEGEHTYEVIDHTDATCTEGSKTTYRCAECGSRHTVGSNEGRGHDFVDGVCTRCGEKEGSTTEPDLEHYRANALKKITTQWKELQAKFDNINAAYKEKYNAILEDIKTADSVSIIDLSCKTFETLCDQITNGTTPPVQCTHDTLRNERVEPTCRTEGYSREICTVCDTIVHEELLGRISHTFDDTGVCTQCGLHMEDAALEDFRSDALTKLDYMWSDYTERLENPSPYKSEYEAARERIKQAETQAEMDEHLQSFRQYMEEVLSGGEQPQPGNVIGEYKFIYDEMLEIGISTITLYDNGTVAFDGEMSGEYTVLRDGIIVVDMGGIDIVLMLNNEDKTTAFYQPAEKVIGAYTLADGNNVATYTVYGTYTAAGDYITVLSMKGAQPDGTPIDATMTTMVTLDLEQKLLTHQPTIGQADIGEGNVLTPRECTHDQTITRTTASTCMAGGVTEVVCVDCGSILSSENLPAAPHQYVNGSCVWCGATAGGSTDTKLEEHRNKVYEDVNHRFNALKETVTVSSDHEKEFRQILSCISSAETVEHIDMYAEKFDALEEAIRNSTPSVDGINRVYMNDEFSFTVNVDVQTIVDALVGKELRVLFTNGTETSVAITKDMILIGDLNTGRIGRHTVTVSYNYNGATYHAYATIILTPDMTGANELGTYTITSGDQTQTFIIYDNGYFSSEGQFMPYVSCNEHVMVMEQDGINIYFALFADGTASTAYRPSEELIGTYTYKRNDVMTYTFEVYGPYSTPGAYIAVVTMTQMNADGTLDMPNVITTDVMLDLEIKTLTHMGFFDGALHIADDNTLYCVHEWTITDKAPTCTQYGIREERCNLCGHTTSHQIPMLDHTYDENGVCQMCGLGGTDNALETFRSKVIEDVDLRWTNLAATYPLTASDNARYNEIKETIGRATSMDIITAYHEKFADLEHDIRNRTEQPNRFMDRIELSFERLTVTAGTLVEDFLQEQVLGATVTIYYNDGSTEQRPITADMILCRDAIADAFDEVGVKIFAVRVQDDNGDSRESDFTVLVQENLSDATLVGTYTWMSAGMQTVLDLYNNGIVNLSITMNGITQTQQAEYTREGTTLFLVSGGATQILTLNDETKEAVTYVPSTEPIGAYTYQDSVFTVYGPYTGADEYIAIFTQVMGNQKMDLAVLCRLDLENATFYCSIFDYTMRFDETGKLYCDHVYELVDSMMPTCTQDGYKEYRCNICRAHGYTDALPQLEHTYDADGVCTMCNQTQGGTSVEELWQYRSQQADMVKEMFSKYDGRIDLTPYNVEFESILGAIHAAQSTTEVDAYVRQFYTLRDRIEKETGGEVQDYITGYDFHFTPPADIAQGCDVEQFLQEYFVDKSLSIHFSISGVHEYMITRDMLDTSRLQVGELGETYLSIRIVSEDGAEHSLMLTLTVFGNTDNCKHSFSEGYLFDDAGHWHECTICATRVAYAAHIDDNCDAVCDACGYAVAMQECKHEMGEDYAYNTNEHWQACIHCNASLQAEPHMFLASTGACVCGFTSECEHSAGEDYTCGAQTHWRICDMCQAMFSYGPHIYVEGNNYCVDCGMFDNRVAEMHSYRDQMVHFNECKNSYLQRTYELSEEQSASLFAIIDRLYKAESYEEIDALSAEFEEMHCAIRASFGDEELDYILDVTKNFDIPFDIPAGSDPDTILSNYILGQSLTLHCYLSDKRELLITRDMIEGVDELDFSEPTSFYMYINVAVDGMTPYSFGLWINIVAAEQSCEHALYITYNNASCENGWEGVVHCLYCDYECVEYGEPHKLWCIEIHEEKTECGSTFVNTYACACGLYQQIDVNTLCFDNMEASSTTETDEATGHSYIVNRYTCSVCSICVVMKYRDDAAESACGFYEYTTVTIYRGDAVLYECSAYGYFEQHSFENGTCTDCSRVCEHPESHISTERYENLIDSGFCGIDIREQRCNDCGYVFKYVQYEDTCRFELREMLEDGTAVHTCSACGGECRTINLTSSDKDENCRVTVVDSISYYMNGEAVFTCDVTWQYYEHNVDESGMCIDCMCISEQPAVCEHQYIVVSDKAPTCMEEGYIERHCELCGDSYTDHLTTDHTLENGVCTVCGTVIETVDGEVVTRPTEGETAADTAAAA